jgi:chromate reductase, NAD(P)H dehydrogenase (quinone)
MINPAQKPSLAIIVGSNRRESINRRFAQALAKIAIAQFDVFFVRIDDLPMYNQDIVSPLPSQAVRFKDELARADGVLFVTPEHNRSIPAVLKNAIDWGGPSTGQNSWFGKPVFLTGTSPGAIGTALGQQHLRHVLGSFLGALVLGGEAYITFKPGLIDDQDRLRDESTRKFLQGFIDQYAALVTRVSSTLVRSAA